MLEFDLLEFFIHHKVLTGSHMLGNFLILILF